MPPSSTLPPSRRKRSTILAVAVLVALLITSMSPITALAYSLGDRVLVYGSRGQDVAQLQTLLTEAGYNPGTPDGVFGRQTLGAVKQFQWDSGLTVDGVVGPRTIAALQAAVQPPAPPPPPPAPAPTPVPPTQPPQPSRLLVMGYYDQNWSGDQDAMNSLTAHANQLDFVSPVWFSVAANGSVSNLGWNWSQVLQTSHSAGAKVLALFNNNNDDTVLQSATSRQAAVANIVAGVNQNNLDGAVLDFESLSPSDRDPLTVFVVQLANQLHANGKLLAVAVGPQWSSDLSLNDGAAAYNYGAIGTVADYVQIMTYDQHTTAGAAGPIAALPWVDSVAQFAATQIPASKILLGIAAYGYEWPPADQWGVVYARDAVSMAQSHNATINWDDASQEPYFSFKDSNGTSRTVWFENSWSVAPKLQIAQKYGLAGVALWRLGQEDDRMWTVLPAAH